jgi:hypothetical protein
MGERAQCTREKKWGREVGDPLDHNFWHFVNLLCLYTRTLLSFPIFPSHRPGRWPNYVQGGTSRVPSGLCVPMNTSIFLYSNGGLQTRSRMFRIWAFVHHGWVASDSNFALGQYPPLLQMTTNRINKHRPTIAAGILFFPLKN